MLTDAHSNLINSTVVYTIDYEAEALESFEATGDDLMEALEDRADLVILESTAYDTREDLGGITVYFRAGALVAFYDYERFVGTVF